MIQPAKVFKSLFVRHHHFSKPLAPGLPRMNSQNGSLSGFVYASCFVAKSSPFGSCIRVRGRGSFPFFFFSHFFLDLCSSVAGGLSLSPLVLIFNTAFFTFFRTH